MSQAVASAGPKQVVRCARSIPCRTINDIKSDEVYAGGWRHGGTRRRDNSCLTSGSHDNADGVRPLHDRFICFDGCEACDFAGRKWKEVSDISIIYKNIFF